MNAISGRTSLQSTSAPSAMDLAAAAIAYPVMQGSLTYSDSVASIMRAAIRAGFLDDVSPSQIEGFRDRIEWQINRTIAGVCDEATQAIRNNLAVPIKRKAPRIVLDEIAHFANYKHGRPLPDECVFFIVSEEVEDALLCGAGV